jgi:hypothetical protein
MPEFTVTERRWVLADYPYTVEALTAGDALLSVTHGEDPLPDRASEVNWEVSKPCSWDVYGPVDEEGEGLQVDLDVDDYPRVSRLGFIGVRGKNA